LTATFSDTRPIDASFHHGTHRQLLADVPVTDALESHVDALIVPTARPLSWLREAMELAGKLDTGVVAMCSKSVKAAEVVELGELTGVPVVAVDVDRDATYRLPAFSTTQLVERTAFRRSSDTSTKRNLALLLSRVAGWQRVLFLDDDIFDIKPSAARAAVGLLGQFDVVGMHNAGCPDNSVVCHVHRALGGDQAQFIGAGALAVAPLASQSFFPNTYNQDWFYILGTGVPTRAAVTGRMSQKYYDPFADRDRSRREELGDCLAEGLYWLLDHRLPIESADDEHWRDFLTRRWYFIDHLITHVRKCEWESARKDRVMASLDVARAASANVTPGLCAEYVRCWRTDLEAWRRFIVEEPVGLGLAGALDYLHWPGVVQTGADWPSSDVNGPAEEDRLTCHNGWRGADEIPPPHGGPGRPPVSPPIAPTTAEH
jgi:hypothetical protein